MIKSSIKDGTGCGVEAKVGKKNQLYVSDVGYDLPELGTENKFRFFSENLTLDGDGITENMTVDGSSSIKSFYKYADRNFDIHIMSLIIFVQDESVVHSKFGNIDLVNGITIYIKESGYTTYLIQSAKNFADIIIQTGMEKPFGADASSFELTNIYGNEDGWAVPFHFNQYIPNGLRLGRGTTDKICCEIADNLTALSEFKIRILGHTHHDVVGV